METSIKIIIINYVSHYIAKNVYKNLYQNPVICDMYLVNGGDNILRDILY